MRRTRRRKKVKGIPKRLVSAVAMIIALHFAMKFDGTNKPTVEHVKVEVLDDELTTQKGVKHVLYLKRKVDPWIGTPYEWGGDSELGIDCSAFVRRIYQQYGIELPRTSYEQFECGEDAQLLTRGDLLFFDTGAHFPFHDVSHVALYMGNDVVAHATLSQGVTYDSLTWLKSTYPYKGARHFQLSEK